MGVPEEPPEDISSWYRSPIYLATESPTGASPWRQVLGRRLLARNAGSHSEGAGYRMGMRICEGAGVMEPDALAT